MGSPSVWIASSPPSHKRDGATPWNETTQGPEAPHRRYDVGATWARASIPVLFPLGRQVTRVPPYVRYPFPSKENRHIPERDDLGPPVVAGGQEIGLGSRNLRPRAEERAPPLRSG